MELTIEKRVQLLKHLEAVGGAEAFKAGIKLLQDIDTGSLNLEAKAKEIKIPPKAMMTEAGVESLDAILEYGAKLLKCGLQCAPSIGNWPQYGICVAVCLATQ